MSEGMLWHKKLGHASLPYLLKLKTINERLSNVKFDSTINDCEPCKLAKTQKLPFKEERVRSNEPLTRTHTDLMGPIKPESYPGNKRFIAVFIDDNSRFAQIYPIKQKSDSGSCLEKYLVTVRNLISKDGKACYIRTDKGREFTGGEFSGIMKREKMEGEFTPPHTPELNGTSERFNKTIQWKIRALMIDSGLPTSMWNHAANVAIHIYNRTPHKGIQFEIPLSKLNKEKKLHLDKIKRFGCVAYAKLPKPDTKFANIAVRTF